MNRAFDVYITLFIKNYGNDFCLACCYYYSKDIAHKGEIIHDVNIEKTKGGKSTVRLIIKWNSGF